MASHARTTGRAPTSASSAGPASTPCSTASRSRSTPRSGRPSDPLTIGTVGEPPGRLRPAARPRPPVPAAPRQLPRQHLGAARRRRAPGARPVRGRVAARPSTGRARSSCRTRWSTARGAAATRSSTTVGPVVHVAVRRPLLPHRAGRPRWPPAAAAACRSVDGGTLVVINGPRFSTRAESLWHAGAGLVGGRHDRRPGGGAGPRAGALLHLDRAGHRPRRRARARRGRHPRGGAAGVRREHRRRARPAGRRRRARCRARTPTAPAGTRPTA